MSRPLDDVVVIDLTRLFCASLGATFLADFGARVLRLEPLPLAPREGGGGEYPLQDGFGWTNGVVRRLIGLYGEP